MRSIAFSVVSFAILKWAFLKLFKTPQNTDVPALGTPSWRPQSGMQSGQEIDKL